MSAHFVMYNWVQMCSLAALSLLDVSHSLLLLLATTAKAGIVFNVSVCVVLKSCLLGWTTMWVVASIVAGVYVYVCSAESAKCRPVTLQLMWCTARHYYYYNYNSIITKDLLLLKTENWIMLSQCYWYDNLFTNECGLCGSWALLF